MRKDQKDLINKRKIAFIYLLHRMFDGNYALMLNVIKVPGLKIEDLQDWDLDYKDAVYLTIQEEDTRGVKLKDPTDVPSIKSIKEKILRRCDALINITDDPSRIAQVYKILSEFESTDEKKEKSVLDAINDSIKPLTPKKKEKLTMLEKMRAENKIPEDPGKRRPGRPRKVKPEEVTPEPEPEETDNEIQEEE